MWEKLTTGRTWDAPGLVMVTEACRLADRLEQMDRLLRGEADAWARVVPRTDNTLVLQVDGLLSEARLTAGALRQLLGQLRLGAVVSPAAGTKPKGSRLDELSAARRRRGAATSDPGSSAGV